MITIHESKSREIGRPRDQVSPNKLRCMIQDVPRIFECAMIDGRKFDVVFSNWTSFIERPALPALHIGGQSRVEHRGSSTGIDMSTVFSFYDVLQRLDRRADLWSTPEMLHASKPEVEHSLSEIRCCYWGSSDGYGGLCSDETLQDVRRRVSVEQRWKLRVA